MAVTPDPDVACPHEDWLAEVGIVQCTAGEGGPVEGYVSEVRAWCAACQAPMVWYCDNAGVVRDRPAISPDGLEMRLPGRPQDAPDTFGLHLPGIGINVREPGEFTFGIDRGMTPDAGPAFPGEDHSDPDDHGLLE